MLHFCVMEAISGNEQNQWGHYYVLLLAVIAPASWTTFCMCWEARTCLTKGEPPQSTQWSVMTQGKSPNLYFWKVCLKALNAWYLHVLPIVLSTSRQNCVAHLFLVLRFPRKLLFLKEWFAPLSPEYYICSSGSTSGWGLRQWTIEERASLSA